jgi:hypothetical protein
LAPRAMAARSGGSAALPFDPPLTARACSMSMFSVTMASHEYHQGPTVYLSCCLDRNGYGKNLRRFTMYRCRKFTVSYKQI